VRQRASSQKYLPPTKQNIVDGLALYGILIMIHGCCRRDLFIQKKKPNEIGFACTYINQKKKKTGMFIVYGGLGNIVDRSLGNLILLNKYDKSRYIKI